MIYGEPIRLKCPVSTPQLFHVDKNMFVQKYSVEKITFGFEPRVRFKDVAKETGRPAVVAGLSAVSCSSRLFEAV
jgi:hypothetical protein